MSRLVTSFLRTLLLFLAGHLLIVGAYADEKLPRIVVDKTSRGFAEEGAGRPFTPWGFNYDHDRDGRLIEDYWDSEWKSVEEDFAEMKQLGANVARVHLQFGKFMDTADQPNEKNLAALSKLLVLAEKTGIYLDLTGLGCYHKADVPAWYDELDEAGRWKAQANFWSAVAKTCSSSPAVFCYDLMNEPVSPAGNRKPGEWLGPAFAGKHFVQMISLEQKDRPRPEIAQAWIKQLVTAIREHDKRTLVTVGLVDWSLDRPGLTSGFVPSEIAADLDFIAVHLYPETDKLEENLATLKGFDIGKPIVIEETFPLKASADDFKTFMTRSKGTAAGWIGFYWGQSPAELRPPKSIGEGLTLAWLEFFEANKPK
jgi:hypothetical protein